MTVKLLVVDDDADIRMLMDAMLTSIGCTAECVADGKAAVEILSNAERAKEFDASLLDLILPEMSGWEVLKNIKSFEHNAALPVIMLTADDTQVNVMKAYQDGASYYIPKPLRRNQIVRGLDLLMNPEHDKNGWVPEYNVPEEW